LRVLVVVSAVPAFAGPIVNLASASAFGLLSGNTSGSTGTIGNTGLSVIAGDVGALVTITGFPPGTVTAGNTVYGFPSDPTVAAAASDFETAFGLASSSISNPPTDTISGANQGTQMFSGGGVYAFTGPDVTWTAGSVLTFDGSSSSVFLMQIPGAMTVNGPITFVLGPGVSASNIYWVVGTPTLSETVTIDPTVAITWDGSILTDNFTMSGGTSGPFSGTINGCVLTTIDITLGAATDVNGCSAASSVPEPGSLALAALGFLLALVIWRRSVTVRKSHPAIKA
jgi:hypothetical protein